MEPRLLRPPSPTRYKGSSQPGRSSTGTLPLRYAYDERDRPRDDLYSQDSRYRTASHDRPYVIPSHMVVRQPASSSSSSSQYRSPRSSADYVLSSSREPRHSAERLVLVPRRERERSKERERPEEYYLPSSRKSSAAGTSTSRTSSSRTPLSTIDSNTSASGEPTRYRYAPTSTILEKDEPDTHRPRHHSEQYYLSPSGASVQRRTHKYEEDFDRAKQYVAARKAQGSRHDSLRRYEYEEPTSRAVRDGYTYTGVGEQAARDLAETKFRYPDVRERRRSSAMYDEPEYRSRIRESHGPPVSTRGFDRIEHVERAGDREHARHGSTSRREIDSGYLQPPIRREERRREGSLDDSRRGHRRHASLDDRGDFRSHRRSYIEPSAYEREREREYDERRDKERRRDERDRDSEDDDAHRRRHRAGEKEREKEKEKEEEKKKHRHGAEAIAAVGGAGLTLAAVEGLKSRTRREKDDSGSEDDTQRRERRREKEKEKEKNRDLNEEPRRSRRYPDETEEERRERRHLRRKQRDEEEARERERDRGARDVDENLNDDRRGARDSSRAEEGPRRRRVRRRRHPEEQEEQETSPSSTSSDEQVRPRRPDQTRERERDLAPAATAAAAGLSTLALSSDRDRDRSYSRPRRPTILSQSDAAEPSMPKSILRKPTVRFPELEEDTRPGVAPHKDDTEKDHTKRWTSINGKLVDPRALQGKERFEVRDGYVLVLRVLSEEEVQYYANLSYALRVEDKNKEEQSRRIDAPLQLTNHAHNHNSDDDSDGERHERHDDPYRSRPRRSKASTDAHAPPRKDKDKDENEHDSSGHDVNVNDPYARPRRRRDEPTTNANTSANTSVKRDAPGAGVGEKVYVPPQGDFYRDRDAEPPSVPDKVPLPLAEGHGNGHGNLMAAKVEDDD